MKKQIKLFMSGSFYVIIGEQFPRSYLLLSVLERLLFIQEMFWRSFEELALIAFSVLSANFLASKSGHRRKNHSLLGLITSFKFVTKRYLSVVFLNHRGRPAFAWPLLVFKLYPKFRFVFLQLCSCNKKCIIRIIVSCYKKGIVKLNL